MINADFLQNEKLALDENASVWISATAGGGKTSLVIKRILKFLVLGVRPEKIFTITYTNEAINEIRNRITKRLSEWAQDEKEIKKDLQKFSLSYDSEEVIVKCQNYFSLNYHQLLEINSFHGFCFKIIKDFTHETNLEKNNLNILTENQIRTIFFRIMQEYLIKHNLIHIDIDYLLDLTLSIKRYQDSIVRYQTIENCKLKIKEEIFFETLNLTRIEKFNPLTSDFLSRIDHTTNKEKIFFEYLDIFLTKTFSPRKNLIKKDFSLVLKTEIEKEQLFLIEKLDEIHLINNLHYSNVILKIFQNSFLAYKNYKKENNFIDFDDIIDSVFYNLKYSEHKEWILYQLNQRFHHFILDEAQDNSEKQWEIIKLITENFFAGTSFEYKIHPTIFVVGDVKQSIYSFQNAKPDLFWTMKDYFKQKILASNRVFYDIKWNFSFRLSANIGQFIDDFFNKNNYIYDLTYDPYIKIEHSILSSCEGLVISLPCSKIDVMKDKILELLEKKIPPQEIMVLFRSRNQAMQNLTELITNENIKIYNNSKIKLRDKPEIKLILYLNNYLLSNSDQYSLIQIINHNILEYDQSLDQLNLIEESMQSQIITLKKIINYYNATIYFQYLMNETVNQRINLDYLALKEMLNLAYDLEKINIKTLYEFNQTVLRDEYFINVINNNPEAIKFLTIHAAKGLEAKAVLLYDDFSENNDSFKEQFYFNAKQELFHIFKAPHSKQITELKNEMIDKNNSENKRLLYVALTRAKEELYIYKFTKNK